MKRLARLAWIGVCCLFVAGFLSACAKAPEKKIVQATAQPYHVGDYELILDPATGTGELKPLVNTFEPPSWGGGTGFTIGVRGSGGSFAGGVWRQDWCVYNTSGSDIYGVAMIVRSYSGTAPSAFNSDNPNSDCYADSCACGTSNGPYHWGFFTSTTFRKGFMPSHATNKDCNTGVNHSIAKPIQITVGGSSRIWLSLMIYEPSGEVVDADADRGIGTAPTAVNDVFVMLGKQSPDPALETALCNGNYIASTGGSNNTFIFPLATAGAVPAHSVTVGKAGWANFTVYNTNLGYTIIPLKEKALPMHYAVGNFNGSLNEGWGGLPAATNPFVDVTCCNQVLGAALAAPNISYSDVYNLSLDVLLGKNVWKAMVGGTSCSDNLSTQYQQLPANLLAIGQTEYLPGIRTPLITNVYGMLNANEYWIPGTGATDTATDNTFVGLGGNIPSSALPAIVNAGPQDVPIGFSSILNNLDVLGFGFRRGVSVSNANVGSQALNINISTSGRITYTLSGLGTIGLLRSIVFVGLNAVDFTNNPQLVRLGALSLAMTAAQASLASVQVPYTPMSALNQNDDKPLMAVFVADLENVTTNGATSAVLNRQNLSGDFGATTFSKWLKLTSMEWTGIQAGAGTNRWVGFSDPDNAVNANFGFMQVQAGTNQTISDGSGTFSFPFQYPTWQLMTNPASTTGFVLPVLPSSSPGVLPTIATLSMDVGTAAAEIPSGNPFYFGWDTNANLYDVLNRGLIGYGTDDTLAADSLSMNKFGLGDVIVACPRNLTYVTAAASGVKVSGRIAAYQWDIVPSATVVKIIVGYKDKIDEGACPTGFAGSEGNGCYAYSWVAISGGNWVIANAPLAADAYNKIEIRACGSGSTPGTGNFPCTGTGGGSQTVLICTGSPGENDTGGGGSMAHAKMICTNSNGPFCP